MNIYYVANMMPNSHEETNGERKNPLEVDDFISQIGEFGQFQKLMFWGIFVPISVMTGIQSFKQVLLAETPQHWCRSQGSQRPTDKCHMEIEKDNGQTVTLPCKYGWEYDHKVFKSTVVTDWDLVCDYQIVPFVAQFAINVGGMIGSILFGYMTDRWGRRKTFLTCLTVSVIFEILTSVAPHYVLWIIIRFAAGLSITAMYQIAFILSIEIAGAKWRTSLGVILYIFYSIGLVIVSGVAYLIRDWRQLSAVTSVVFLLYLGCWKYIPESPRWLLSQGRFHEATAVLETMAKCNKAHFKIDYSQDRPNGSVTSSTISVLDLFKTPNMRKKTILLTFCWVANMMVYCGLCLYGPSMGSNPYLSFALSAAVELPSHAAMIVVMKKCPRRLSLCVLMIVGGISCVAIVAFPPHGVLCLVLFLIGKFAISSTYLIVYTFGSELYPTEVRGIGLGLASNVGMFGNAFIPFINYSGLFSFTLPLIFMGILACCGGVLALGLPETLNKPLPQTLEEGEEYGKDMRISSVNDWLKCQ